MLSVSKKGECPEYVECIPFPHSETINNRNVDRRTGIFVINPKPSKLSLLQITFTQRGKKSFGKNDARRCRFVCFFYGTGHISCCSY